MTPLKRPRIPTRLPNRWLAVCFVVLTSFVPVPPSFVDYSTPKTERFVARSGGIIEGLRGTNSQEALDRSYDFGFRWIHLEFEWTTDGHLVLLSDWGRGFSENFLVLPGQRSLAALQGLPMRGALTPLTADSLLEWLDSHPEVTILADVRRERLEAMRWLAKTDPKAAQRFVPLVDSVQTFDWVRELGFARQILDVQDTDSDGAVLDRAGSRPFFAVVLDPERALRGVARQLRVMGIKTYVRPVNSLDQWTVLRANGVSGFFTDVLDP